MTLTDGEGKTVFEVGHEVAADEAIKNKVFTPITISTEVDPDFADEDDSAGEDDEDRYNTDPTAGTDCEE